MKKIWALLAILALSVAFCLTFGVSAAEDEQAQIENAIVYDGLSAKMKGNAGIRSLYLVDREAIAALEEKYDVAYGAIMGIGEYAGNTINTAMSLAVDGTHQDGFSTVNSNAKAIVIYASGTPSYAGGKYLDSTKTSFAYTTVADDENVTYYHAGLVYSGFLALSDKENGALVGIYYDPAVGSVFGSETATYGISTSMNEIADYFVNAYAGSDIKTYCYNQCETLRGVLRACGGDARVVTAPVTLSAIEDQAVLARASSIRYVNDARAAYTTAAYADYTTSIIQNYTAEGSSAYNDRPLPVTFTWAYSGSDTIAYVLEISEDQAFTDPLRYEATGTSFDVYNLKTGTTYYWRLEAKAEDGSVTMYTEPSAFETADTVRWIYAEGARNVRDIGGWNGLKQGFLYRGSELNYVDGHGLNLTAAGKVQMHDILGIKTDLDFRAVGESANGNITESPIGSDVALLQYPIGNFMSLYGSATMFQVIKELAVYENYPVYMHCWGGADRTGTVGFMIAGMCGAAEEDLSIDLEQTAFAIFGNRYRYDNGAYLYASMIARMKTYEGNTLEEKFLNCARTTMGLTEAEISNIRSIFLYDGAVFTEESLADLYYDADKDEDVVIRLYMRASKSITSLTIGGISIPYTLDAENGKLTLAAADIEAAKLLGGTGKIVFDDGTVLSFGITTSLTEEITESIVAGNYHQLFAGCEATLADGRVTVTPADGGSFYIPSALIRALRLSGYESINFVFAVSGYTSAAVIYKNSDTGYALTEEGGFVSVRISLLDETDVIFVFTGATKATVLYSGLIVKGTAWGEAIENGAYDSLHPNSTLTTDESGKVVMTSKETDGNIDTFISAEVVNKLIAIGYTGITFTVEVEAGDYDSTAYGIYIALRGGLRADAPSRADGGKTLTATYTAPLVADTKMQIICRRGALTSSGSVTVSSSNPQVNDTTFAFHSITLNGKPKADVAFSLDWILENNRYDLLFTEHDNVETSGDLIRVTAEDGAFRIPSGMVQAMEDAGYESLSLTLKAVGSSVGTATVYDSTGAVIKTLDFTQKNGALMATVPVTSGGDIAFSFGDAYLMNIIDMNFNAVNTAWAETIENGSYTTLFGVGEAGTDANGDPTLTIAKNGNFRISGSTLEKLMALGYTHMTLSVDACFAEGTQGCYLAIRVNNGTSNTKYDSLTSIGEHIQGTITLPLAQGYIQFITRTCALNSAGTGVNTNSYTAVSNATVVFSNISFTKEETDERSTLAKVIEDDRFDLLFNQGAWDAEAKTLTCSSGPQVTAASIRMLYDAGYTNLKMGVLYEVPNAPGRCVIRWRDASNGWQGNYGKWDIDNRSSGALTGTTTVNASLNTTTVNDNWRIYFEIQRGSGATGSATITISDFVIS